MKFSRSLLAAAAAAAIIPAIQAWDYEGHRLVNGVALTALPAEFPAFVREPANAERILFLSGEPDRWRNVQDRPLSQAAGMDHYLDAEDIPMAGLDLAKLPSFRFDFAVQYAAGRQANLSKFPAIDPAKNSDHTREWPGFAPWAITENFAKLRSAFSYLRAFEERGTPEEIANAQANVLYIMGVMGHYVGDCAQPLHTTMHHHGWVGANPNGYTTWTGIHSFVDGVFIAKAGVKLDELKSRATTPASISLAPTADGRDPMFVAAMEYLQAQFAKVEPLYQLEKTGGLGNREQPITPEAREFITGQLVTGGRMLAAIWITAWKSAGPDNYLLNQLANRKARQEQGVRPPPQMPLPAPKSEPEKIK